LTLEQIDMSTQMKRRDFVRNLLLGVGAPLGILNRTVYAAGAAAHPDDTGTHDGSKHHQAKRRLVLIELAGANDGLNTLVPFTNDRYHILRPGIGLHRNQVLPLEDSLGMHQALQPLMRCWERGQLAWIQGLGYPQANRSHFKSIALWETAGDGRHARGDQGWMTHAVEHQLARAVSDPHGISLSGDLDIFASETGRWLSLRTAAQLHTDTLPLTGEARFTHPALALIQSRLHTLETTLARLAVKVSQAPDVPVFDADDFGEQLRQVAILIAAGVDTPVYRVRLDGFDTHENQQARHARLLNLLARGLDSFSLALESMGEWQDTLVMTYSEFGRRASENHSGGTDHGTAAPHLVMGGAVRGGLYGTAPDLAELPDGDPLHTMDYRALYQCMLTDGLGCTGTLATLDAYRNDTLNELLRRS
jgi:uncharacterized protein (DUF1501 family)